MSDSGSELAYDLLAEAMVKNVVNVLESKPDRRFNWVIPRNIRATEFLQSSLPEEMRLRIMSLELEAFNAPGLTRKARNAKRDEIVDYVFNGNPYAEEADEEVQKGARACFMAFLKLARLEFSQTAVGQFDEEMFRRIRKWCIKSPHSDFFEAVQVEHVRQMLDEDNELAAVSLDNLLTVINWMTGS